MAPFGPGHRTDGLHSAPPALPPSVNYHLWQACNMRCRFCFAPFQDVVSDVLPAGHLEREKAIRLTRILAARFEKVTFAGGEPTLCPWIAELARAAHEEGAIVNVVTNGSRLPQVLDGLRGVVDWITLSIDSASTDTLVQLGRAVNRKALSAQDYNARGEHIREAGMRLKVNTVVTSLNAAESLSPLMRALRPERWKLLRVLPVEGQNSGRVEPLLCTDDQYSAFVARHRHLDAEGISVVPEDNEDMRGSYAMVDPAGRFFDNASGGHRYTSAILDRGIDAAWAQAAFSMDRFVARGGRYDWGAAA
ncbi:MAG TPA: viperin family antiviral radical SAM protein [Longimicrobium sp.]|uniref:viperin family antiviral radical SAM protein n=1 Tax=Longimicrobium sp. TaxID=2029185 RepID=UPI002ED9CB08